MDIAEIERVASRLEHYADAIDGLAGRTHEAARVDWDGAAADAYRDRVTTHHDDLDVLADRVRDAAGCVRDLGRTAGARVPDLDDLGIGVG